MDKAICDDCQKEKEIVFQFKAVADGVLIDVKLCKGCMRNRGTAAKQNRQNH